MAAPDVLHLTFSQPCQYSHQKQEPLWVTDTTPVTTIGYRLEETDQISRRVLPIWAEKRFGHGEERDPLTKPEAESPAKGDMDTLLGNPAMRKPR
jgi:hypothetical protein